MKTKLQKLQEKITEASQAYYEEAGTISDATWDGLLEELRLLSPNDALLKGTGHGYDIAKDISGEKVAHKYRYVGSLNKINKSTAAKYFESRPENQVITSKIDGLSMVVYYGENCKLINALTGGDGTLGVDRTTKLRFSVPQVVRFPNIAIRGEVTMRKDVFETNYPDAAHPRNTVGGILGKDNPTDEELQRLVFVAYSMYGNGDDHLKKTDVMDWLSMSKFTTAQWVLSSPKNAELYEDMKGVLDSRYPADGIVITNENDRFDEIAYKFQADQATTTVKYVEWVTSRLGIVFPTVHFEPVKLSGAILAKCSGSHAQEIRDKGIDEGAKIIVHRAGEVIPDIVGVELPMPANMPNTCPSCNGELQWESVHLVCRNPNCPAQVTGQLLKYLKTIAPVDNMGDNLLTQFIDVMEWETVEDIYLSDQEDWEIGIYSNFESEHAQNLLEGLSTRLYEEPVNPEKFVEAFGSPSVGNGTSKRIASEIGLGAFFFDYDSLAAHCANLSRCTEPAVISLKNNWHDMKKVFDLITNRNGFTAKEPASNDGGVKICLTGKLSRPRKNLIEEFDTMGYEVVDSVTKGVAYLVTDDPTSGSSKNLKAQKLGVVVISEENFRKEGVRK